MGFFQKKLNSDEYEKLKKEMITISGDMEILKTALQTLQTNQNSLRGFVNRKMGRSTTEEEEETDTENNKYRHFLP